MQKSNSSANFDVGIFESRIGKTRSKIGKKSCFKLDLLHFAFFCEESCYVDNLFCINMVSWLRIFSLPATHISKIVLR